MANTTVNIDVQVQTKSLQELENELEDINSQLKEVPVGSDAFKELSQQAQAVTKDINQINNEIEGFTLEKKVRSAQGSVTALAGGLEATVGTLGLIGIESEVFGKFEEKAISAIAASRGFIDIADGVQILSENIDLATLKAQIFGKVSRKALIATGIGAFVVALGLVVANFEKITELLSGVNQNLERSNKFANRQLTIGDSLVTQLTLQRQAAAARGESEEEIVKEIRKQLLIQQEQNNIVLTNLQLQLQKEQSAANEVTFFERMRIAVAGMISPMLAAQQSLAVQEGNQEKINELQDLINESKERQAQLDLDLATLSSNKVTSEQEYLTLVEELETKLLEFNDQTQLELLQAQRENVLKRINELEIEDDKKRELLEDYTEYFNRKEEELTQKTQDEAATREQIRFEESQARLNNSTLTLNRLFSQTVENDIKLQQQEAKTVDERLAVLKEGYNARFVALIENNARETRAEQELYDNLISQAKEAGASQEEIDQLVFDKGEALRLRRQLNEQQNIQLLRETTQEEADILIEYTQSQLSTVQQFADSLSEISARTLEAFSTISESYFEVEQSRLARERSAIESNTNLTEEQRIAALNKVEQKENELEKRRIERERDLFTIKQSLLLAEEILKTKLFVQEQIRIAQITASQAAAAGQEVAVEGAKQVGKASMSLGSFVSTLGPLGAVLFAASIGGIIASIISARREANEQIKSISGAGFSAASAGAIGTPAPVQNQQPAPPQEIPVTPIQKTYVLTGDVTSGQEAENKLNSKRTI